MANELRDQAAEQYEQAAAELEAAADHLRITARHFRDSDVPRASAHAVAAFGHIHTADGLLKALAVLHASKAQR